MAVLYYRMASLFTKIINREIPAKIFYETDEVIVIADIRPKDEVHLLIIPKKETKNFYETPAETLAMLNQTAKLVADKLGIADHFRLQINNGYGQEIDHVHLHFLSNKGSEKLKFL
jgi:histidine triad (HIT) family protein